ncbi:hypothetical protein ASPACDRAFT_46465 [Aspergillus aculeatus ATCC 16872]|uniref:Uncharacterized protein n=1 Tax=Aspergillus aculeatus (strain ATCC 16872 / CBS 172.66 / WB 5094) TaxID=690307 RepID=A0A1L9WLC3_ASPA1|nr:uncharacterized protein ASPACDRAFT_46465 [Aspergillus aculeatus ATCC 16872]OJJ96941.1 hypothetical protein ASPACDRAFT_46465 [Aspergillus aculeatus ATCC 16872]
MAASIPLQYSSKGCSSTVKSGPVKLAFAVTRAAGRSPRSTSVGSLKPIAPRPVPSSTGGGSSSGGAGIRRDSHSPPTGDYGDHRPRSTISASPPPPLPPSSQLYQQQQAQGHGLIPGTPGSSPIYLPGTSTSTSTVYPSPSYCTISDIPSSLSMVNPLDFENGVGVSFVDSASAAAIYALEDLDVNSLPADVFQGDWSWLSLSEEAALRDEV